MSNSVFLVSKMDDIEVIDAKPDLYTNGAYIEPNIE